MDSDVPVKVIHMPMPMAQPLSSTESTTSTNSTMSRVAQTQTIKFLIMDDDSYDNSSAASCIGSSNARSDNLIDSVVDTRHVSHWTIMNVSISRIFVNDPTSNTEVIFMPGCRFESTLMLLLGGLSTLHLYHQREFFLVTVFAFGEAHVYLGGMQVGTINIATINCARVENFLIKESTMLRASHSSYIRGAKVAWEKLANSVSDDRSGKEKDEINMKKSEDAVILIKQLTDQTFIVPQ